MHHRILRPLTGLSLALLLAGLTGCDMVEDVFGGENEISGTVEEVGADFLTVDATRYDVTSETVYEGYTALSDVQVGDAVDIEYEDREGGRFAVEIEDPANEDGD
jgi:hypothetical protein